MKRLLIYPMLLLLFSCSETSEQSFDPSSGLPMCPALNNGNRLTLSPPLVSPNFVRPTEGSRETLVSAAVTAQNLVSFYEDAPRYMRNGAASYDGLSLLDGLSVGQMQWNWNRGRGTLVSEFFRDLPASLVQSSNETLNEQLGVLRTYAATGRSFDRASQVIESWQSKVGDEQSDLHSWLTSRPVRSYQDQLVAIRFERAAMVAETWIRDTGSQPSARFITSVYFFNLNVQAGIGPSQRQLRGVWWPQVSAFQTILGNDRQKITDFILAWISSCETVVDPRTNKLALTGGSDTFGPDGNSKCGRMKV